MELVQRIVLDDPCRSDPEREDEQRRERVQQHLRLELTPADLSSQGAEEDAHADRDGNRDHLDPDQCTEPDQDAERGELARFPRFRPADERKKGSHGEEDEGRFAHSLGGVQRCHRVCDPHQQDQPAHWWNDASAAQTEVDQHNGAGAEERRLDAARERPCDEEGEPVLQGQDRDVQEAWQRGPYEPDRTEVWVAAVQHVRGVSDARVRIRVGVVEVDHEVVGEGHVRDEGHEEQERVLDWPASRSTANRVLRLLSARDLGQRESDGAHAAVPVPVR